MSTSKHVHSASSSLNPVLVTDPTLATGKIATLTFDTRVGRRAASDSLTVSEHATPPSLAVKYLLIEAGVDVLEVRCAPYTCTFTVPESTAALPSADYVKQTVWESHNIRAQLQALRVSHWVFYASLALLLLPLPHVSMFGG